MRFNIAKNSYYKRALARGSKDKLFLAAIIIVYGLMYLSLKIHDYAPVPYPWIWQLPLALGVMAIAGASVTGLIQTINPIKDRTVLICLSVLNTLIIIPVSLLALSLLFGKIDTWNILIVYLAPPIFYLAWSKNTDNFTWPKSPGKILRQPFFWAAIFVFSVHAISITRFSHLPALDTYSWLISFEQALPEGKLGLTNTHDRWAFAALMATIYHLGQVDLFVIFKYLFPFISLLTLFPLWLIARNTTSAWCRWLILCSALASPTVILEFEYTRQQVIFLLFLFYAVGLHYYAVQRQERKIFYLLGMYGLAGTLIHPAFYAYVLSWLTSWAIIHWRLLWRNQYLILVALLIINLTDNQLRLGTMAKSIFQQARAAFRNFIAGQWNLNFPAQYVNSDGYEVGWSGAVGVTKYYAFYAGPLVILLGFLMLWMMRVKWSRRYVFKTVGQYWYTPPALLAVFFLFITELTPRFGRIAYLPDRAWQYLGILMTGLIFVVAGNRKRYPKIVLATLTTALAVNIFGALYVNSLNTYTMPDYEKKAAVWMKQNLAQDSEVFASSSKNLIRYHAGLTFRHFPAALMSTDSPGDIIEQISWQLDTVTPARLELENMKDSFKMISDNALMASGKTGKIISAGPTRFFEANNLLTAVGEVETQISQLKARMSEVQNQRQATTLISREPIFIYYASTHGNNLYNERPYRSSFTGVRDLTLFPALDNNENLFKPVYSDGDRVRIWQVKTLYPE